jgi:hypothetical protein
MTGLAGSLLVFTGFWHAFEWLMGGRNRDTMRLVPFGLVYVVLGFLLVAFVGGAVAQIMALAIVTFGMTAAYLTRETTQVRPWVTWVFIIVDVVIVAALVFVLVS